MGESKEVEGQRKRREEEKGESETGRRGRGEEELLKQAELSAASLLLS